MRRLKLTLEYDGRDFVGWQLQPNGRSVQGEVEAVLEQLLGHAVRVHPSGRTDAGVHALAAVCTFDTEADRDCDKLHRGLNGLLPDEIAVLSVDEVSLDFDPRHWSWGKRYRYRWLDRVAPSPLRRGRVWHVRHALDVAAMNAAVSTLVGRHDFASFRAQKCGARHTVRTIDSAVVTRQGDEIVLEVRGQGFLRHMVRIIAGCLHDVGRGKLNAQDMAEIRDARDRTRASRTAPPHGLALVEVLYKEGPPPWKRPSRGD